MVQEEGREVLAVVVMSMRHGSEFFLCGSFERGSWSGRCWMNNRTVPAWVLRMDGWMDQ